MSDTVPIQFPSVVKLPVALAHGMLLTDTFKTAGRSAMILDSCAHPHVGTHEAQARDTGLPAQERSYGRKV